MYLIIFIIGFSIGMQQCEDNRKSQKAWNGLNYGTTMPREQQIGYEYGKTCVVSGCMNKAMTRDICDAHWYPEASSIPTSFIEQD